MDSGFEKLSVNFSIKAQQLFISTYEKFRLSTKNLDRQRDENVFQMQVEKFMATFKEQLERMAHELLTTDPAIKKNEHCNRLLRDRIIIYLNEFRQKTRSL